jgi:hypothetical protein
MSSSIVVGTAAEAASSAAHGWVIGHFMEPGVTHSTSVEIKVWRHDRQPTYWQKAFAGTEFVIVEGGIVKFELSAYPPSDQHIQEVELKGISRDYVIIPPGYSKRLTVIQAPVYGLCVRWPSEAGRSLVLTKPQE